MQPLPSPVVCWQIDRTLSLRLDAGTLIARGQPIDTITCTLGATNINTKLTEGLLNKPGMISGAIGDTLDVNVTATLTPPAGASGKPFDIAQASIAADTTLTAPRLKTNGPLKAALQPDRITLTAPANLEFTADPTWLNPMLAPAPAPDPKVSKSAPPAAPALVLANPMPVQIALTSFTIAKAPTGGPAVGPLKPGIFGADAKVTIPSGQFTTADKQAIRLANFVVALRSEGKSPEQTDATFSVLIGEAAVGDQPGAKDLKIDGRVDHLAGANGEVDTKNALITADSNMVGVPTALVDAFAKQGGMLGDLLGPTVGLKLHADRISMGGQTTGPPPVLDIAFTSDRANAKIKGTTRDGAFVSETPIEVNVIEVTEALSARFVKGLPSVGSFVKMKQDAPAMIVGKNMQLPLGNDFSKLNGTLEITPGVARFGTSSAFGQILQLVKVRDAGSVGRNLDPINVNMVNGLISYNKYKLPLGEFTVSTEGHVDMVARQVDVVTWVPFGALTDEVAGLFKAKIGIGAVLGQIPGLNEATMVPFRTKGSLDNPGTKPDLELFVKDVVGTLKPEKVVDQLGDLFKKVVPKKK
jgi:hypothetical protein